MGAAFRQDLLADGHAPEKVEASVDRSQQRILSAPAAILLCLDMKLGDVYPDPARQQAEYLMGVQSVALAGGTLLLAAHAEGLGGVWVCAPLFARNAARRALELPVEWEPQGLIFLGYPEKTPDIRPRVPLATVTRYL
jgi:F420 biosynthesis protein FbiB-like protein